MRYVTILRTERIQFAVNADRDEDAREQYLMDGDEIASETVNTVVESISPTR